MFNWEKWAILAQSDIDQLQSNLEDCHIEEICSLIVDSSQSISSKLAVYFLLQLFLSKLENDSPFRFGCDVDQFKAFLERHFE